MAKQFTRILAADKAFPSEMRRQLWPLCCGAAIISGFKDVAVLSEDELVEAIHETLLPVPDLQVFVGETINPKLTFLTLNSSQMSSQKIMNALNKAGFVKIGEGKPRGGAQGFFIQDQSGSFCTEPVKNGKGAGKEVVAA